ncbi:MAG: nickel insertion protein [Anaerovoracaceae bacterium]|jgi:uncharacterized protein (DUF111 family)
MRQLYIDARSGAASDMIVDALIELGADEKYIEDGIRALRLESYPGSDASHEHESEHEHVDENGNVYIHKHNLRHRTFYDVKNIIGHAAIDEEVKKTAIGVYTKIATAEAEVHHSKRIMVEFHEVGRDRAISHVTAFALALHNMGLEPGVNMEAFTTDIVDGRGTVMAAHGLMEVPVPAVRTMAAQNGYRIRQDDVPMEMITPTGIGMIIGIGSRQLDDEEFDAVTEGLPSGIGKGTRDTGKPGLRIYLK